eukprot:12336910-Karenia_brevis.AAC.1
MASKVLQDTRELLEVLRANEPSRNSDLLSRLESLEDKVLMVLSKIPDQLPLQELPDFADNVHSKE